MYNILVVLPYPKIKISFWGFEKKGNYMSHNLTGVCMYSHSCITISLN